ncbi:hypothetical protein PIB30_086343 [Stylosanthes scabra]|uniref:Retrotransposon gag domain-containing protein n=1 Tax=Stylosanthes scabra TaxID=79078 RepID=A0ABU6ZRR8_9FABA|nr:hypothetical protein [Stylosanthes scabra]
MKKVMRNQFVPSTYREKFLERLDRLKQGSKSVKEYHMERVNLMIKANAKKSLDALMRRFLDGLDKDVAYQTLFLRAVLKKLEDKTKSKITDLKKHHKKKSSNANFHSSSTTVMEEFVEYAVSGDVYVDDEPMVQQSSEGLVEYINVDGEKESQPIAYFSEHLHGMCLRYSTYGKAVYVLHLIVQGILNKRHAQSVEFLESFPLIEQDSRTDLFDEGENDTC